MRVTINGKDYEFMYGSFGPLYTFETIAKKTFDVSSVLDMHMLLYATLLYCNKDTWKMSLEDFFQILFDDPNLEETLTQEVVSAWKARSSRGEGKKKE